MTTNRPRCYPCETRTVHPFHDNGIVADSILCENISGDWGKPYKLLERREELCGMGFCLCSIVEVWREQHDGTRAAG